MEEVHQIGSYFSLGSSTLTCLACLWLFYKFCGLRQKNIGFSMIFILSIADFLLSILMITTTIIHLDDKEFVVLEHFSYFLMFFSIYWASAMAFLVYNSLKDQDFTPQRVMRRTILLTFIAACLTTAIVYIFRSSKYVLPQSRTIYIPMILALLFTLTFYIRSIFLLKKQSGCYAKSTRLYIRSLRCYAYSQLILYLPAIGSLIWLSFANLNREGGWDDYLSQCVGGFITLSGFVNALNFAIQGPTNDKTDFDIDDNLSEGGMI